jgi:hypothetical protein
MSERVDGSGERPLGDLVRELAFDIDKKMARDGEKTDWLDSFRNLYTPISGAIGMAQLGISEENLPADKEAAIIELNDAILREAQVRRTPEEAQKAILPLIEQLGALMW